MTSSRTETKGSAAAAVGPKRYDEVFKRQAAGHWLRSGRSGTQIAKELGISYPGFKEWKRCYAGDSKGGSFSIIGTPSAIRIVRAPSWGVGSPA